MSQHDEIALLQSNLERLLSEYADLKSQVGILTGANNHLRQELAQSNAKLVQLQHDYDALRTAHALSAVTEDRERAKRQINAIITKIDRTLELMQE